MKRAHVYQKLGPGQFDGYKCLYCHGWVMMDPLPIGECPGRKTSVRAILMTKCGATQTIQVPSPPPNIWRVAVQRTECPTCGHNARYAVGSSMGRMPNPSAVNFSVEERVFELQYGTQDSHRDPAVYREV